VPERYARRSTTVIDRLTYHHDDTEGVTLVPSIF